MSGTGPQRKGRPTLLRVVLAWGVHFYTALGLVAAAGMAVCIYYGTGETIRWAFLLMLAASIIDASDGTLARAVRVKEVLPHFDGRRLDDLIDFVNFTCLPLFLIWQAGLVPEGQSWWLLLPLLASAYGFCQAEVKTDDGYFLGFPSYWNLVAFYLYALQPVPAWVSVALMTTLAVLTFVPSRYLYPSTKRTWLNQVTIWLGVAWSALLAWTMFLLPDEKLSPSSPAEGQHRWLALVSLVFPIWYLAASWAVSWKIWKQRRRDPGLRPASGHPL